MKPRIPGEAGVSDLPPVLVEDGTGREQLKESVTTLIAEAQQGRQDAWERIYGLLYKDLHRIARSEIRNQRQGHLHSATSLVHETWIRLSGADLNVNDRSHLIALIVRAMRYVLLDEAEYVLAKKRGGAVKFVELDELNEPNYHAALDEMLALNRALTGLEAVDSRLARIVEMRYFGGLGELEIAELLQVSVRTVRRDWRTAKAFLLSQMESPTDFVP